MRRDALEPFWQSREELVRLGQLTLAEYLRHNARFGEGGKVVEADGLVLFSGSHSSPNPYRNGAIRTEPYLPAAEVLQRAASFFTERRRPYALWVRDEPEDADLLAAARQAGLPLVEDDGLPQLVLEQVLPPRAISTDAEAVRVESEAARRDYVMLVAEAWGLGGIGLEAASAMFFHPDSVDAPNVAAFIAYVDGRPASAGMAIVSYGVALACQGATVPSARRQGLGEAVVRKAVVTALDELGAAGSVCQTSPLGARVWTRIGFTPYSRFWRFLGGARGARPRS